MDTDTAEYLLSMASSYAAVDTGLLQQLEDTLETGSFPATLQCLRDYGYFDLSPAGQVTGLTPQGFELLRELRGRRRTTQRAPFQWTGAGSSRARETASETVGVIGRSASAYRQARGQVPAPTCIIDMIGGGRT